DPTLEVLIAIAAEASRVVAEVYATPFTVEYKGPRDPVTVADRRANDLICERLERAFPGTPIVAEESPVESFAAFRESDAVFFVDPVDGTNEFIEHHPEFVVMIGLLEGKVATRAVIHAPVIGTAWAGSVGQGAVKIESDGARSPVHVTGVRELGQATVVSSRSHRTPKLERALAALGVHAITSMGSAGLKGAAVARGSVEAHVAPHYAGKRWDVCAAEGLVAAAGGRVTDAWGDPIDYRAPSLSNDRGLVASNGLLHDALLERLRAHRGEH
ncbi:MAG TPA: 3'(2'),5'-bisphosphate nucleotidase CysQ, partial [Polyangiaceae bacterium]|nr:3'(2'),5'-bisphosphate nucleotidase CysQ [Polyangiaceae bacterium]